MPNYITYAPQYSLPNFNNLPWMNRTEMSSGSCYNYDCSEGGLDWTCLTFVTEKKMFLRSETPVGDLYYYQSTTVSNILTVEMYSTFLE